MHPNGPGEGGTTRRPGWAPIELSWALDDEENPASVTIYSGDGSEVYTHWITIDVCYAVTLEEAV